MSLEIGLVSKFLVKLHNTFFLSPLEKEMYNYFSLDKKKTHCMNKQEVVLIQCVEDYFYYGLFGVIIKSLKEKKEVNVEQYVLRNLSVGSSTNFLSFIKSILVSNKFRDNKWIKLYNSYCDGVAYSHTASTSMLFDINAFFKAYKIFKNLKSKEEVLSLVIDDISVGDLIYDSFLRFKPAPTVDLNSYYLCLVIWHAIRTIHMTKQYFEDKKPTILLTSYSTYIQHGIAVRIAVNYDTKVFSFGNNQILAKQLTKDNWYHTANFHNYKDSFERLINKEQYLHEAKVALEHRFSGGKDVATYYMKESAYKTSLEIEVPYVQDHIIVFLHDFFDSPHVYGNMLFPDFLEWIEWTIEILEQNHIPYCLKPHPNQIGDSAKVIDKLKFQYPNINFISPKITNKQLVEAGISAGISVYGTVAHELVYMGVPAILCGDNPHKSYNFCFEAKSKDEYEQLIIGYKNLALVDEYKKEIESFYYMHSLSFSDDMKQLMSMIVCLREYDFNKKHDCCELFNSIGENIEFKKFILKL